MYCVHLILYLWYYLLCFVFFKQKTAYEMRISDWSSDVCSSDLAGAVDLDLADRDVAVARHHRGVDHVDGVEQRREQALQQHRRQRPRVEFGDMPLILDDHGLEPGFGELAGEAAELFGEAHVGAQARRVLCGQRRHVDGVAHRADQQEV